MVDLKFFDMQLEVSKKTEKPIKLKKPEKK
jgi:hypothetical protein